MKMSKLLVALLATAGIAGAAYAQSNVTIYGVADVSVQGTNISQGTARAGGPQGGTSSVQSNNSLLGFKGTEDLGNGLKALFQLETNVNLSGNSTAQEAFNNGTTFGSMRDSFVGVQNKLGLIQAGYFSTPYKNVVGAYDVFPGATGSAQADTLFGRTVAGAGSNASAVSQYTMNQTAYVRSTGIMYSMPTVYGVNGQIMYSGNGGNNNTNNQTNTANVNGLVVPNSTLGFNLGWNGYGFGVTGAFQQSSYTNAQNLNVSPLGSSTNYLVGVNYTGYPGLKIATMYGRNTENMNTTATTGSAKGASNSVYVGASYRFGNNEPRIAYANTGNTSGLAQASTFGAQNGASQYSLGWGYYLSKRTQVYGIASVIHNNANGVYNFANATGQGTNNLTGGQQLVTYGVGLRTNF